MGYDKIMHIVCGYAIAVTFGLIFGIKFSLMFATVAGALKELYDHFHPETHSVEIADFFATVAGGVAGCIVLKIIAYIN